MRTKIYFCFACAAFTLGVVASMSLENRVSARSDTSKARRYGLHPKEGVAASPPPSADLIEAWRLASSADVLELDDKLDDAIKAGRRRLDEREKSAGPDDPSVGDALLTLGALYTAELDFPKAEKVLKRARELYEKIYGSDRLPLSYALWTSAFFEMERGQDDDAETWLKQSLAIKEKVLGENDPEVATAVFQLAEYYQAKRNFKDAGPLYDRALAMRQQALPADDPLVLQVLARQACILRKTENWQEAGELEYRAGVGRKPEYEKNGKYKHPDRRDLLDGKIKKRARFIVPPLMNVKLDSEFIGGRASIGPNGKVLYACSQYGKGTSNFSYLIERNIARSAFQVTKKDGVPVMVDGYLYFYSPGHATPSTPNPFNF